MKKFLFSLITIIFLFICSTIQAAQVTLAWDENDPVPTGYRLFQRAEDGSYDYDDPVYDGQETQATVEGLAENTTYYFVARAYSDTEESGDSNEISYTVETTTVLSTVSQINFDTDWSTRDTVEYYGTTDQTLTCSWLAVDDAEGYEVALYSIERDSIVTTTQTTDVELSFTLPRTGHYIVKVRACKNDYSECSEWFSSNDSTTTDGWIIYGTVSNPGSITIE